jgi:hypothetical protein
MKHLTRKHESNETTTQKHRLTFDILSKQFGVTYVILL